ncbi:hypothetical protein Tco_0007810 [Tanacetum coccineum]
MVIQAQEEMGEGSAIPNDPHHTPIQPSTSQPQKKQRSRKPKRKDTEVPQPSFLQNNSHMRAAYRKLMIVCGCGGLPSTATGLDVEQDSGNINKTQSKATPNESSSLGTSSGGGPKSMLPRNGESDNIDKDARLHWYRSAPDSRKDDAAQIVCCYNS